MPTSQRRRKSSPEQETPLYELILFKKKKKSIPGGYPDFPGTNNSLFKSYIERLLSLGLVFHAELGIAHP